MDYLLNLIGMYMDYLLNLMGKYQATVTAFATIVIAVVTLITFMENRKLRKAQTKPRIVA